MCTILVVKASQMFYTFNLIFFSDDSFGQGCFCVNKVNKKVLDQANTLLTHHKSSCFNS